MDYHKESTNDWYSWIQPVPLASTSCTEQQADTLQIHQILFWGAFEELKKKKSANATASLNKQAIQATYWLLFDRAVIKDNPDRSARLHLYLDHFFILVSV